MRYSIDFTDLREYMRHHFMQLSIVGLDAVYDTQLYEVAYQQVKGRPHRMPRYYKTLYGALVFNCPGPTEQDALRNFETWKIARWNTSSTSQE